MSYINRYHTHFMKVNKRLLAICIAIPLITGAVAGFLTRNGMEIFKALEKPPLSPPGWLFPVVWTVLYILMGISMYLVLVSNGDPVQVANACKAYHLQLGVNFLWSIFFFGFGWYLFSFVWLLLLWILVLAMIVLFSYVSKTAAYLNIPYLIWLTFAAYLNAGVWFLNQYMK